MLLLILLLESVGINCQLVWVIWGVFFFPLALSDRKEEAYIEINIIEVFFGVFFWGGGEVTLFWEGYFF